MNFDMEKKLLIVPDVHGRPFWKKIQDYPDIPVVFLGDYLDPYDFDGVTPEMALDAFKELLEYVKTRDNCTMLYGNHDLSYAVGKQICQCRTNHKDYDEIRKLFWENKPFYFSYYYEGKNKKFVFTHAGLTKDWIDATPNLFANRSVDEVLTKWKYFNDLDKRHSELLYRYLSDISSKRGGWKPFGSLVWADVAEHFHKAEKETEYVQVFGHSYSKCAIKSTCEYDWYMLDCKQVFYIDEDDNIRYLDSDKLVDEYLP